MIDDADSDSGDEASDHFADVAMEVVRLPQTLDNVNVAQQRLMEPVVKGRARRTNTMGGTPSAHHHQLQQQGSPVAEQAEAWPCAQALYDFEGVGAGQLTVGAGQMIELRATAPVMDRQTH